MNFKSIQLVLAAILCCLFLIRCNINSTTTNRDNLVNKLNHYSSKPHSIVDFSKDANFHWDTLYIFPPYTPLEEISKLTKTKWLNGNNTTIDHNDSVNLFVFTKENEVVCLFEYPRDKADFNTDIPVSFSRKEAVFNLTEKNTFGQKRIIFSSRFDNF